MPNRFAESTRRFLAYQPDLLGPDGTIEVIVKYHGDILAVGREIGAETEILNETYAIMTIFINQLESLFSFPEVEFIELPKFLVYMLSESLVSACISSVQNENSFGLTGRGTLVGIIDSGIDFTHPDFRNEDGTSRILSIWDQSRPGTPPPGFKQGTEYSNGDLNEALANPQPYSVIPRIDEAGHGTAVAGIAAGNGRSSRGRERGAAPEASIIAVKLGRTGSGAFARTTEIMRAIKYMIDRAQEQNMPLSINISYGTNDGSHDGDSLFETYIDSMADRWKTVISVATGNEGSAGHHFADTITEGQIIDIPFVTTGNLQRFYMTFWKNFVDTFTFELISPSGRSTGEIRPLQQSSIYNLDNVNTQIVYRQPTNYSTGQEIYFLFESRSGPIPEGIWRLLVNGEDVTDGQFDIWLPTMEDVTRNTSFSRPSVDTTLTLPSTAQNVISVGGYNAMIGNVADFSGRGYTRTDVYVKPDLVAPAVNIISTRAGGGYDSFTGTSVAAPFVTGAAALMMQWGIVDGNDPFLYGQRVKAFLQKGAQRSFNIPYPNPIWGYGTLCLLNSMNHLTVYT